MKWFKMDCDVQQNLDMRKMIDEWGWEWFGRYVALIGMVGRLVNDSNRTFALQTNDGSPFPVRLLANDLSTTVERLSDFCQYLADNRLIDGQSWNKKKLIYIPKLADRADEYTKRVGTKSRHSPEQEVDIEVEVEQKKIREEQFAPLWDRYPRPLGKKKALQHFLASVKTPQDLTDITTALENYLKSPAVVKGEEQYIQHGSTWFNNWRDWMKVKGAKVQPKSAFAIQEEMRKAENG
jgi:hypothetical protein